MQIDITGRGFSITEALKQIITEKFEELNKRYALSDVHVVLGLESAYMHFAEATVKLAHTGTFHAIAHFQDMYECIDILINKINAQLLKHKEQM